MGGRGAGYSLTGSGEKSKGTIASENKFASLESELNRKLCAHMDSMIARQGQGWHASEAGARRRAEKTSDHIESLRKQIEHQKVVVERQRALDNARGGLFDYKGNLNITERNLKQVKALLRDIDKGKVKSGRTKATERAWRKKVANLEKSLKIHNKVKIKPSAQRLIDSGKVKQWSKRPELYFVTGAKKTALVLKPDGTFGNSARYYGPATKEHGERVKRLIETGEW